VARLYRETQGVVITEYDRRGRTVALFFRDCGAADSAEWAEAKLAAHPAERVLTNDPASLTFEECERFEAIESVFAGQF
jgi:adenine-specific DNA-methyltransferase